MRERPALSQHRHGVVRRRRAWPVRQRITLRRTGTRTRYAVPGFLQRFQRCADLLPVTRRQRVWGRVRCKVDYVLRSTARGGVGASQRVTVPSKHLPSCTQRRILGAPRQLPRAGNLTSKAKSGALGRGPWYPSTIWRTLCLRGNGKGWLGHVAAGPSAIVGCLSASLRCREGLIDQAVHACAHQSSASPTGSSSIKCRGASPFSTTSAFSSHATGGRALACAGTNTGGSDAIPMHLFALHDAGLHVGIAAAVRRAGSG